MFGKELENKHRILTVCFTVTRRKGWCVCFWLFLWLVTEYEVLLEDMQQLSVGATLDAHRKSIRQVTVPIDEKILDFQALKFSMWKTQSSCLPGLWWRLARWCIPAGQWTAGWQCWTLHPPVSKHRHTWTFVNYSFTVLHLKTYCGEKILYIMIWKRLVVIKQDREKSAYEELYHISSGCKVCVLFVLW